MTDSRYKEKKLLNLLICLESLDLYNEDNKNKYMNQELENIKELIYSYKKNTYCNQNKSNYNNPQQLMLLNIIHEIISRKDVQHKIVRILNNYYLIKESSSNNENELSFITYQYLNRFIYKYQNRYYHDAKYQNHNKKVKHQEILGIGILNLYLLYKSLSQENTYFLYQYLTT
uniref:Conserved hypothetical plastid protein n=1 Tax=Calliarthron tuberculosum TaxID=48942 RepID=M4IV57_CALTB|nr:conserved hypothetical plastid protein [Calliarthron tuberculosum]AGA63782.1 conserved hypothetical plastid protein [Calliarthron tuberculosum]